MNAILRDIIENASSGSTGAGAMPSAGVAPAVPKIKRKRKRIKLGESGPDAPAHGEAR